MFWVEVRSAGVSWPTTPGALIWEQMPGDCGLRAAGSDNPSENLSIPGFHYGSYYAQELEFWDPGASRNTLFSFDQESLVLECQVLLFLGEMHVPSGADPCSGCP